VSFYRRYSLLIGVFLLACVIVLLLSKPSTMFSREVYFMDDEPFRASPDGVYVKTKLNLGDSEHMKSFPLVIGEWEGIEYDSSYWEEYLEAEAVLLRAYEKADLYQPVFLQIVQGQSGSSVHQPTVCYEAQGYTIEEQGDDTLLISDVSWAEEGAPASIPIKKMLVSKESDGQVTERRIVVYWYVEGNRIASNTVTIIEVSAYAPLEGSYEGILDETKDFAAQVIPYVFAPSKGETLLIQLTHWGALGYFIILSLICIPVVLAVYPRVRPRRIQNPDQTEPQK
jgi:EpsI family protein